MPIYKNTVVARDTVANFAETAVANGEFCAITVADADISSGAKAELTIQNNQILSGDAAVGGISVLCSADFSGLGTGGFYWIVKAVTTGQVIIAFYNMTPISIANLTFTVSFRVVN